MWKLSLSKEEIKQPNISVPTEAIDFYNGKSTIKFDNSILLQETISSLVKKY